MKPKYLFSYQKQVHTQTESYVVLFQDGQIIAPRSELALKKMLSGDGWHGLQKGWQQIKSELK